MIFLPGDQSDKVYLLKAGVVKISKYSDDGKEIILGMVNPGEIFGELALIDPGQREHVAEAVMDSFVCIVDRKHFLHYLQKNPQMSLHITKIIGLRLKNLGQRVEDLVFRNVHQRLAGLLLDLLEDYGYEKRGNKYIYVRLTHNDIASLTGSTRETITAALNDFKRRGMIDFDGRRLVILNRDELEKQSLQKNN